MAKNITRTITTYTINYLALDDSESVATFYVNTTEANPHMPKHPEKVAAAAARDIGVTFIKVKSVETSTTLYSMTVEDFINRATPIPTE